MLRLHDEVVRISYLGCCYHFLHRGIFYAKGYVVVEGVVEEYRLLVHVAYERTQIVDANIPDVLAIYEYLATAHIVVAWYEVNEG